MALKQLERDFSQLSKKGSDSPGLSSLAPYECNMKRKNTYESDDGPFHHGTAIVVHPVSENVSGTDAINEISDSTEIMEMRHNPLADARIIEDKHGY